MKTAVAVTAASLDARVARHFGKCEFFCIRDNREGPPEFVRNPGKDAGGCRGEVIVQMLARKGIRRVISGDFGSHVQDLLNGHQVQMIIFPDEHETLGSLLERLHPGNREHARVRTRLHKQLQKHK